MEENMYCQNRISYRVQEGDSLYKLAKQFHTTVTELILLNSGVNPYNLQTGMRLTICPGEGYVDENESKPSEGNTNKPTKTPVGGIVIIPGTTTQPGGTTRPGTNSILTIHIFFHKIFSDYSMKFCAFGYREVCF